MGKAVLDVSLSLDGFITGPNVSREQPLGEGGERLHDWMTQMIQTSLEIHQVSEDCAMFCGVDRKLHK